MERIILFLAAIPIAPGIADASTLEYALEQVVVNRRGSGCSNWTTQRTAPEPVKAWRIGPIATGRSMAVMGTYG